jgi:Cu(I)/Ag(I) efflux system periplasmic protein CusF
MKLKAIAIALFTLAATAHAQSGGMKGMDMKDMPKQTEKNAAAHKATGVVTKLDKDKVTIQHGPVQSMSWPAMTMAFRVRDKALMGKLGKDRKVDFEFRQEGKDYVITAVK